MRVPTVVVYVLASLAAWVLTGEASAYASTPADPNPLNQTVQPSKGAASLPTDLVVIATDVQVIGASEALQQTIRNTIQTQPGGETSQSQLQNDVTAILNTGLFSQARVLSRVNSAGLSVVYEVEPIVVRSLQLSGAQVLPEAVVNDSFRAQLGAPVNPLLLDQAVQQINQWYTRNGYSLAKVLALRPDRSGVIGIEVAEGVIGNVNIRFVDAEGKAVDQNNQPIQGRTREDFLKREIQLKPGQIFREEVARQDVRQLSQLGLFDQINVSLSGDARNVDVTYDLAEAPARTFNLGGGYNEVSGIYGVLTYRDRNISGIGQQFNTDLQIGQRDLQFNSNFISPYRASDPDTLGYRIDSFRRRGLSDVFDDQVRLPNGDKVQEGRIGGGIAFTRTVNDWQGSLGLNYTRISIRDGGDQLFSVDQQGNPLSFSGTGIDDLTTISFVLTRDQRDSRTDPTQGSVLTLSTEQSIPIGLGNILSNRFQANYVQYIPVRLLRSGDNPEVIAFNLQGGTTLGDLPPYRAFNLGGLDSVRGYDPNQVGSGRSYVLASAEYRFPFFSSPVAGVFFADFASDLGSGNAVPGQPALVRGKPGTGFSYGAGLRVQSPLGILRADFGINDQGESRIQLGIGQRY